MARKKSVADSKYPGLTQKQALVFEFIEDFCKKNNFPPTVREICNALMIPSTSTVYYYLQTLEKEGYIHKNDGKMRAIEIIYRQDEDNNIPQKEISMIPIVGEIAAGSPILAQENITDYYPLPLDTFRPQNETFVLKIKGESMVEAGIMDGDYVIVEKCNISHNGEIVAAMIEGEATVKRFFQEKDKVRLQPENSSMEPIYARNVEIIGKVIGLFRSFK